MFSETKTSETMTKRDERDAKERGCENKVYTFRDIMLQVGYTVDDLERLGLND